MSESTIELLENGVRVRDLDVPRKAVADFLAETTEEDREVLFVQAVEVGTFCLERAAAARDLDFVRHQVDELMRGVEAAIGQLPSTLEAAVVQKMGDGDGQILAPIRGMVEVASETINGRVKDVRDLFDNDLDPAKATSTLGSALSSLKELMDPVRKDSIQGVLADAVQDVVHENGALAKSVKNSVSEAVKPLADELNRLGQLIAGAEAVDEALRATTKKGTPYELEIVSELQEWGARMGAVVEHVGGDNYPGDVLVQFPESSVAAGGLSIIIEVRDRGNAVGRKVVSETLAKAISERSADTGIYLSKSTSGLAKELGEWAEGECANGPFVATTHEYLLVAVRWLLAQEQLRRKSESIAEVDCSAIEAQIDRVRTALKLVKNINTNLTHIRSSASAIEDDADKLRSDVRSALTVIEEALRAFGVEEAA